MFNLLPWQGGRQRNLRILLFVIILATLPLYCLGFVLWGVAPGARPPATATPSPTPRLNTATPTRTSTPYRRVIVTATRPLPPTPRQFRPPAQLPQTSEPPQPEQPPADLPQPAVSTSAPAAPTPESTPTVVPVQELNT